MSATYKTDKCEVDTALGIGGTPSDAYAVECSGANAGISLKEISASLAAKTDYGILYNIATENEIEYTDPDGTKHILLMNSELTKSLKLPLKTFRLETANPPGENNKDGIYTLDFDPSTEESIYLAVDLPNDYKAASAISIRLKMFVDTDPDIGAGNKAVFWTVEYKKLSEDDTFNFTSGANSNGGGVTIVENEGDAKIHYFTIVFTPTGYAANDTLLVRLSRDATKGNDDYPSDARLFMVSILYKSERRGT